MTKNSEAKYSEGFLVNFGQFRTKSYNTKCGTEFWKKNLNAYFGQIFGQKFGQNLKL